jgi:hypothetical protein
MKKYNSVANDDIYQYIRQSSAYCSARRMLVRKKALKQRIFSYATRSGKRYGPVILRGRVLTNGAANAVVYNHEILCYPRYPRKK